MKTSLCSAAIAAVLLSIGLSASQAYGQTPTSAAVIDIPYIFKNHIRFQQAINDIKKDIDAYQEVLKQDQQKIRVEAEKATQYKPGTREYKAVEEAVARMRVEQQLEAAKQQKEFMEREARAYFTAYKEVEAAVQEFAVRHRLTLVLRYSGEDMDPTKRESIMQGINRFVVYQERLNITDNILEMLNRGTPTPPPTPVANGGRAAPHIPPR